MNKIYEIIIDGTYIEVENSGDIGIAITSAVSDAQNLTVRKASNVKTIPLPGTHANKIFFGHPHDINSVVNLSQSTKPVVIILANGVQIFKGYAKLNGSVDNAGDISYTMECIGNNGDWVARVGGRKLKDLDYSDQNHYYDYATIVASETVTAGREYVYDLIDRGEFSGQLYGPIATPIRSVNVMDRKPAISNWSFVQRIFNSIGYKVVSNLIDSAFFRAVYYPFVNELLLQADANKADLVCFAGLNVTQSISFYTTYGSPGGIPGQVQAVEYQVISSNPSGAFGLTTPNYYFCKGKAKYKVRFQASFDVFDWVNSPTPSTFSIFINLMKQNAYTGSSAVSIEFQEITGAIGTVGLYGGSGNYIIEKVYECEFGDELFFQFNARSFGIKLWFASFEVEEVLGPLGVGEGGYIDMNLNLPDELQLDYLQGLKEGLNLFFDTDTDARVVYIESHDDFYALPPEDWSGYLDKKREIQIQFTGYNLSKKLSYRYKNDSNDKFVDDWQKNTGKYLGAEDVDITNVFAKDEVKVMENKFFAATWMDTCPRIGIKSSAMPRMWSDVSLPPFTTKFLPRMLYYAGVKALASGESWKFNQVGTVDWQTANPTVGIRTTYPYFFSYDETGPNDNNLMYHDTTYSHGLQQKYFRNAQRTLDDGRMYIAYIEITDLMMSNLSHRKTKWIEDPVGNGSYFILDKASDFKSEDGVTTKCSFVKLLSPLKKRALAYESGAKVALPSPPVMRSAIAMSPDGMSIMASGTEAFRRSPSGIWQQGGGPVYAEISGLTLPVYFTDDEGNIQQVILE